MTPATPDFEKEATEIVCGFRARMNLRSGMWEIRLNSDVSSALRSAFAAGREKGFAEGLPKDARERIARALFHAHTGLCDSCLEHYDDRDDYYQWANAVLRALAPAADAEGKKGVGS